MSPITTTDVCYGGHKVECEEACSGDISCTQTPKCVYEINYANDPKHFCISVVKCLKPSTTNQSSTTTSPVEECKNYERTTSVSRDGMHKIVGNHGHFGERDNHHH